MVWRQLGIAWVGVKQPEIGRKKASLTRTSVALAFPFLSRKCSPLFAVADSQAFPLFMNSS
jgi:hypothetical protein